MKAPLDLSIAKAQACYNSVFEVKQSQYSLFVRAQRSFPKP
jgi:hypothetical protein